MAARPSPVRSVNLTLPHGPHGAISATVDMPAEPSQLTAVVAHCFTCDRKALGASRISKTLARHGIASLRLDFTDLTLSHNVDEVIAAAEWLRDEHGAAPGLLVGHSLGGVAAIRAATQLDSVRAVATVGTPFDPMRTVSALSPQMKKFIESQAGSIDANLAGRPVHIERSMVEDLEKADVPKDLAALAEAKVNLLINHSPTDMTVPYTHALNYLQEYSQAASLFSLPEVDHLLTRRGSGQRVGSLISQWALPYMPVG
ncbi:alpha/beta hydrolase family protein [Corynebacterium suicordis]|uniref:Alpha/beta hydrolase n=1 Tax=Corynebacterium suicordis DSM 45110 TaxID=1121369 RepID=A0ABR9ZL47_9CORY|nr:alpha/beta hydrolase [Corynebacterium suicordis]MBF4553673.1 alpha/beta hydrolase [Corynebacterium suicordis DSM 45110]MDR6277353.1 pimeloyl-ACP methyl ester carboxylesterase [Corynebacterium suicordis]